MIKFIDPSTIELSLLGGQKLDNIKRDLTYTDQKVLYEIKRLKNNPWFVDKYGYEAYYEKLNELKAESKKCILTEVDGRYFTNSGLARTLSEKYELPVINDYNYPESGIMPWYNLPKYQLRDYQSEAIMALLSAKHGCIEHPTGAGKSATLLGLVKSLGLKTVVVAPSTSIFEQLCDTFTHHLGGKFVGKFGDGKKQLNKTVTIAMAQTLTRIKEGSKEWNYFKDTQVLVIDESHLISTDSFKRFALGLFKQTPYRFFVSATLMRNDGSDVLLDSIIGPLVHSKTAKELMDQGYLAKPHFVVFKSHSDSNFYSKDALRMINSHVYNNAFLHKQAAHLANNFIKMYNVPVFIAIDHIEQFKYLFPHLSYKFGFAHGGVTAKNKQHINPEFHKSNPTELVEKFNNHEIPLLIGTGCIGFGTDTRETKVIINLQAGKSPIKFMQLVGRGTRITPTKKEMFWFIDFDVENVDLISNQLEARIGIYRSIYDNVSLLKSEGMTTYVA
jgi:superfamily II DNA or RNA helicase